MTTDSYCAGASCEAEIGRAIALVAGRWSVAVLEALHFAAGPVRFKELQRRVAGITQKELTRQLSNFVHHGAVRRRERAGSRAAVDYALTEKGFGLLKRIEALGEWVKTPGFGASALRAFADAPAQAGGDAPVAAAEPAQWLAPLRAANDR